MKKPDQEQVDTDIRAEYNFSGGVRGKYAARYLEGSNIVVLDPDVAEVFTDSESVNDALRSIAKVARKQAEKDKEKAAG